MGERAIRSRRGREILPGGAFRRSPGPPCHERPGLGAMVVTGGSHMRYLDDDEILENGQTLKVPMSAMDAQQRHVAALFRPGYVGLTDEQARIRQSARNEYIAKLSDAWRGPQHAH